MANNYSIPKVTVGILSGKEIKFDLFGEYKSFGFKHTFSGKFTAQLVNDRIICKRNSEKIEISDEISFEPSDISTDSFLLHNVIIGEKFHWERKENQRFVGSLKLIKNNGKITAVNILPIESYLTSVISSEMSAKSSIHLLKAHAVVSRSWLLAQMEKSKLIKKSKTSYKSFYQSDDEIIKWYDREDHKLFDVCADDHCQRYQGITKIFTEAAKTSVQETQGLVLESGGKICDTRYSKSCGGITESFDNVWEPVNYSYLASVVDYKYEPDNINLDFTKETNAQKWITNNPPAYCNTQDKKILSQVLLEYDQETKDFYRWRIEYSQEELASIIKDKTGIDFGDIIDLVPIKRGASGRLMKLKIIGSKKTLTIGKELEIRRTLSRSHLYSSAFVIEKPHAAEGVPKKFTLIGAGWGHGVGLCQIGAAVMASQGHYFDEILLHYFKDAKLVKKY